jgi:hypothetical protein
VLAVVAVDVVVAFTNSVAAVVPFEESLVSFPICVVDMASVVVVVVVVVASAVGVAVVLVPDTLDGAGANGTQSDQK